MTQSLAFIGVSNTIVDLIEHARDCGFDVAAIVINAPEVVRPRTSSLAARLAKLDDAPAVVALRDYKPSRNTLHFIAPPAHKRAIVARLEGPRWRYATLVHPTAHVSRSAQLGDGILIGPQSVIGAQTEIGDHTVVGRLVAVGHDNSIGRFCRVNNGATVAGHVQIGDDAIVGIGATIVEELEIGERAVVAAGAVVIRDVAPDTMVAGVPAVFKRRL